MSKIKVRNVPDYALKHECWVVIKSYYGYWFSVAYDEPQKAIEEATEIKNGLTLHRDWCERA